MVNVIEPMPETSQGTYDMFKRCVLETIPSQPTFIRRQLEHQLEDLGVKTLKWRREPERKRSDNGHDYWFFLGEGEYQGTDFNAFHQAIQRLGERHRGWVPGFNPAWMGTDVWCFNFTVAARAL